MNVNLLYDYKEWTPVKPYFDWNGMVKDLGLATLFRAAGMDGVLRTSRAVYSDKEDTYVTFVMKRVSCVPLGTREEVEYRQEILADCMQNEEFLGKLYLFSTKILEDWDRLGRKRNSTGVRDTKAELITDVQVLRLLISGIEEAKDLFAQHKSELRSRGFRSLSERLEKEFSEDFMKNLEKIMQDLSFYVDVGLREEKRNTFYSFRPKIKLDCGLTDGLKLSDFKLESMETVVKPYSNPYGIVSRIQGQISHAAPNVIALYKDQALLEDAAELEFQAVSYVYDCCSAVADSLGRFYDQLHFQLAFYLGAVNLKYQFQRYQLEYCFPKVCGQDGLQFENLKEVVMSMEQKGKTIGNDGALDGKSLVIITGANQGGKSTFLRSIGIAQVMMQCGLMVVAKRYQSGLYPSFFTHFTRREDSAMNSGRLDEELRRMNQIVSNLGERSLLLLNESFATTTEKEGSAIAYDVIRALKEEGVRILTVTHLLSFAQRVYEEAGKGTGKPPETEKAALPSDAKAANQEDAPDWEGVTFLSAEHLEDGTRTYKMIPHAPEMTSFGLELYDEILSDCT